MQIKFGILKKGDTVLNVWDQNIAIKRKNGEVEIVRYEIDTDGLPRLSDISILITEGNGTITTKNNNDSSVEITTF